VLVEGDRKVPKTNYTDPGISFPRLQAKIFTIDGNTYFVTVWLWEEAGGNRRQVRDGPAGSLEDAHLVIEQCAEEYGADVSTDDIDVEL